MYTQTLKLKIDVYITHYYTNYNTGNDYIIWYFFLRNKFRLFFSKKPKQEQHWTVVNPNHLAVLINLFNGIIFWFIYHSLYYINYEKLVGGWLTDYNFLFLDGSRLSDINSVIFNFSKKHRNIDKVECFLILVTFWLVYYIMFYNVVQEENVFEHFASYHVVCVFFFNKKTHIT